MMTEFDIEQFMARDRSDECLRRAGEALQRVVTPEGIQASDDYLFRGAVFGRDSEIVGLDLIEINPAVSDMAIKSMIRCQGTKFDANSEEEPGRIHHEARFRTLGDTKQKQIYDELMEKLQIGMDGNFCYYGSVDATPQFIRLVDHYRRTYGDDILGRHEKQGDRLVSVEQSVYNAACWISERINKSDIGLFEFRRTNPNGITWQVLRDGASAYLHEDGRLANPNQPIASIEVQGLAYDALLMATDMVGNEIEREAWRDQAERLREQTFNRFWCEDKGYWAMAIDRDETGSPRQVTTETSLPAELLETSIFENLPSTMNQEKLIAPIVRKIFSSDFLTPVGIRMRSLAYASLLSYSDYQGAFSVWPVSNNIIAKGLHRYGLHSVAQVLEYISLQGTEAVGGYPEFMMVDNDGAICWPLTDTKAEKLPTLLATNAPELNQAWTVSACLRMLHVEVNQPDTEGWQIDITREIAANLGRVVAPVQTRAYLIDKKEAVRLEKLVTYSN